MFGSILLVFNQALKKLNDLEVNIKFRGGLLGFEILLLRILSKCYAADD